MSSSHGSDMEAIEQSLTKYRQTVLEQNLRVLQALITNIEQQPHPYDLASQDDKLARWHVLADRYLGGDFRDLASSPQELLSTRMQTQLARRFALDGVFDSPIDVTGRKRWFSTIALALCRENLSHQAARNPPADLQHLCTLANSISGPGLPYHREQQQCDFISDISNETSAETAARVIVPIRDENEWMNGRFNALTHVWDDWQVEVAFKVGDGPRDWSGSYALYCCKDEGAAPKPWDWRYGVHDGEWRTDLYDSIQQFLKFYAHFREQTLEDVQKDLSTILP